MLERHHPPLRSHSAWGVKAGAVLDMTGLNHFSIISELENPSSPLARAIQSQMGLA